MSNYDQDRNIVKQVQTAVNAQGYHPPLAVDGIYGPLTQAGVQWFQGQHGLAQDGIIGDQTLAATISIPTASGPALVPPVTSLPVLPPGLFSGILGGSSPAAPPAPPVQSVPKLGGLYMIPYSAAGAAQGIAARKAINAALDAGQNLAIPGAAIPGVASAAGFGPGAPQFHAPGAPAKKVSWPMWLGLVAGTVVGTFIGGPPVGSAIGAIIGGAGGVGTSALMNKKVAAGTAGATMHGEHDAYHAPLLENVPIIAGDIGMPAKYHSLLG